MYRLAGRACLCEWARVCVCVTVERTRCSWCDIKCSPFRVAETVGSRCWPFSSRITNSRTQVAARGKIAAKWPNWKRQTVLWKGAINFHCIGPIGNLLPQIYSPRKGLSICYIRCQSNFEIGSWQYYTYLKAPWIYKLQAWFWTETH